MDRPDSEMAEWHAPWETSRDIEDGEVRAGFSEFCTPSAADNRQSRRFLVSFQAKNHRRGHVCRRTSYPVRCNDKFAQHWAARNSNSFEGRQKL